MPKPKKAARGKHRWVAFRHEDTINRSNLKQELHINLEGFEWRLFDVLDSNGETFAILKTPLEDYGGLILKINNTEGMSTFSSSGKIRLLRQRLYSLIGKDPSNII